MDNVAPHAGAWIETIVKGNKGNFTAVAPHAGAWIETASNFFYVLFIYVAPHAGAWIETSDREPLNKKWLPSRAPRGRVD